MSNQSVVKPPPIDNRQPAAIQVTAAQFLIDSKIHEEIDIRPPAQRVMDEQQLSAYKQVKRREFQDKVRRQRSHIGLWVNYAKWEQTLSQFKKARSVYERAIQIDYSNKSLWLKYAQFQMRHKFFIHARNVWQRAIHYMPREDQFWYKYAYMEELLSEYQKARDVFQRWMTWQPGQRGWDAFIKYEERLGQRQRATVLVHRFMQQCPSLKSYMFAAKYQIQNRNRKRARQIFERVVPELGEESFKQDFFIQFARFEIKNKQIQRARAVLLYGLKQIPRHQALRLGDQYLNFQKLYGKKTDIDRAVFNQRNQFYKQSLEEDPLDYDSWLSLADLLISHSDMHLVRECYQKAVSNIPPTKEKRHWRRYIYLWYNYAFFQEQIMKDIEKAQSVFQRALKTVPLQSFSFSQLWVLFALFQVRQGNIDKARKILGNAIGKAPRPKIFRCYIELQQQLCNLDRVRKIYLKYLQVFGKSVRAWREFALFEKSMDEEKRARAILQIAGSLGIQNLPIYQDLE